MRTLFFTGMATILGIFGLDASTLTLQDNRVLRDVKVLDVGIDSVKVQYAEGVETIRASQLPADWQERYQMTPVEIEERKKKIRQTEEEIAQRRRETMSESEKHPRYLTGRDVLALTSSLAILSPLEAEAAAARWNISEANRLGDPVMSKSYSQSLISLTPQLAALTAEKKRLAEETKQRDEAETKQLRAQLATAQATADVQAKENQRLSESLQRAESKPSTVITTYPSGWDGWNRPPVLIVPKPRPTSPIINITRPPVRPGRPQPPGRPHPQPR